MRGRSNHDRSTDAELAREMMRKQRDAALAENEALKARVGELEADGRLVAAVRATGVTPDDLDEAILRDDQEPASRSRANSALCVLANALRSEVAHAG